MGEQTQETPRKPASYNFQRTELAQRQKTEGRVSVRAEYRAGRDGQVHTYTHFGERAALNQSFNFDAAGDLSSIEVAKVLQKGGNVEVPMSMRLIKMSDGKFEVTDRKTTPDLPEWQREFEANAKEIPPAAPASNTSGQSTS